MSFSIEHVGDAFKGKGKAVMIGGVAIVAVAALYVRSKNKTAETSGGTIALSSYPQAPQGGAAAGGGSAADVNNLALSFNQAITDMNNKNTENLQKSNDLWGQRIDEVTQQFTTQLSQSQQAWQQQIDKLTQNDAQFTQLVTSVQTGFKDSITHLQDNITTQIASKYDQQFAGYQQQIQSGLQQISTAQAARVEAYSPSVDYGVMHDPVVAGRSSSSSRLAAAAVSANHTAMDSAARDYGGGMVSAATYAARPESQAAERAAQAYRNSIGEV